MKMKLLYALMLTAVMSALVNVASTAPTEASATWRWTTAGPYAKNLNGKMFTLSTNGGGISFSSPYFNPTPTTWPFSTQTHRFPTTTTYPFWTTASPTRGVSACLRFLIDYKTQRDSTIFTLSPNSESLRLLVSGYGGYSVYFGGSSYNSLLLRPDIKFWSYVRPDIWTRVCLTVDTRENVAQLFSGGSGSIRKILPYKYVWSGEPTINFPGFDGQVTDVQVWDYPLRYREVLNYMTGNSYGSFTGSVLTWSSISYSARGEVLLEDTYEWQAKQPISSRGRRRRPKGDRKPKELFYIRENKAEEKKQL